jgi:hypothetical protein
MMIGVSTMHYKTTAKLTFLVALLAGTGACTKKDGGIPEAAASHSVTRQTVKAGAALEFSHRMQASIKANTSNSVTVNMSHGYAGQSVTLTANADKSLKLATSEKTIPLVKGQTATWTIPFSTSADGLYYINIIGIVKEADGTSQARAYSVRVEVGDQIKNNKPIPKEVIMPAEEKISK